VCGVGDGAAGATAGAAHHVLVTGKSGVHKTNVLEALRTRGCACVAMDDESLSFHDDVDPDRVAVVEAARGTIPSAVA
jgi:dephospho-CoA kinase